MTANRAGWLAVAGTSAALAGLIIIGGEPVSFSAVWMRAGELTFTVGLRIDRLSRFAAILVCLIALPVEVYAIGYMRDREGSGRFFAALLFFVGAMLILVLAGSTLLLFAAWELVGLASWLLIGQDQTDPASVAAAAQAFLVTRIADLAFLLGWLLLLITTGTTDLAAVLTAAARPAVAETAGAAAALMLIGAAGKSAQLPFSVWLPDAMRAPTPVSALLHSATMVAAGVYLLVRLYPVVAAGPQVLDGVLWLGMISAFAASLIASGERDLKRLLAWSTIAQLGEMLMAIGVAAPLAALFHLTTHAAFKSTLFLDAGAVERETGTRDLDALGGLACAMPWTAATFGVASLALAGLPPFAGYFSEEAILAAASTRGPAWGIAAIGLVFLSGTYISRAAVAAFGHGETRGAHAEARSARSGSDSSVKAATDPPLLWLVPMLLLGAASIGLGWALHGSIGDLVGLAPGPSAATAWSAAAVVASVAGLAWGGLRAHRRGAAPAFGSWPAVLRVAIERALAPIAVLAERTAARTFAIEHAANAAARGIAGVALLAAGVTDAAEARAFDQGGEQITAAARAAGNGVRRLQAGPVYFYTLSVVVWLLAAGLFAIAIQLAW